MRSFQIVENTGLVCSIQHTETAEDAWGRWFKDEVDGGIEPEDLDPKNYETTPLPDGIQEICVLTSAYRIDVVDGVIRRVFIDRSANEDTELAHLGLRATTWGVENEEHVATVELLTTD